MNKAIQALQTELDALFDAKKKLEAVMAENANTDFAFYCDFGLAECERHIIEVQQGLKLIKDNDRAV